MNKFSGCNANKKNHMDHNNKVQGKNKASGGGPT